MPQDDYAYIYGYSLPCLCASSVPLRVRDSGVRACVRVFVEFGREDEVRKGLLMRKRGKVVGCMGNLLRKIVGTGRYCVSGLREEGRVSVIGRS